MVGLIQQGTAVQKSQASKLGNRDRGVLTS